MKQHLLSWKQSLLALTVLISAGLSSCNRAEYAMLPKTSSYHGTERVAATKSVATPAPAVAEAPAAVAPAAEVAAVAQAAPAVATAPVAKQASAASTAKPSLMQKMLVKKALKSADKVASKVLKKKHSDVSESNKLEGKLRQGVILLVLGLVVQILGGAIGSSIIVLLGGILALIGLILIVLYLLDEI